MRLNRRSALGVGVALPLVTACGAQESTPAPAAPGSTASSGAGAPSGSSPASPAPSRAVIPPLGATSDIEVGGGRIYAAEAVVVTQPTAGEFKAFDARCTHKGCLVAKVEKGEIVCTCHFSKFSITDGAVESGQATEPLASLPISVTDGEIYLG